MDLVGALAKCEVSPYPFIPQGLQVLNVAKGGALHQRPTELEESDIHHGLEGGWPPHEVWIGRTRI